MRIPGARQGSTSGLTFRRRLAAGAALCIAATTTVVLGASVPALANVSAAAVTASRPAAGAQSSYTIDFNITVALVAGTDTVTIVGPTGTNFPLVAADYTVGGMAPAATPTGGGTTVTLKTSTPIPIGAAEVLAVHVTNPAAGPQTLTVQTSKEPSPVTSSAYTITAATAYHSRHRVHSLPVQGVIDVAQYTIHSAAATRAARPTRLHHA